MDIPQLTKLLVDELIDKQIVPKSTKKVALRKAVAPVLKSALRDPKVEYSRNDFRQDLIELFKSGKGNSAQLLAEMSGFLNTTEDYVIEIINYKDLPGYEALLQERTDRSIDNHS